jgi:hypothetical protein
MDDIEDRAKIELSTGAKRLELTLLSLNEAKAEISDLRDKNLALEKALLESRMPTIWVEPVPGRRRRRSPGNGVNQYKNDSDAAALNIECDDFSSGETDGEEEYSHEGLEELRSVIRERYSSALNTHLTSIFIAPLLIFYSQNRSVESAYANN